MCNHDCVQEDSVSLFCCPGQPPPRAGCVICTGLTDGANGACTGGVTRLIGRHARKPRALGPTGPPRPPPSFLLWCTMMHGTMGNSLPPRIPTRPPPPVLTPTEGTTEAQYGRGAPIGSCRARYTRPRGDPGGGHGGVGVGPRAEKCLRERSLATHPALLSRLGSARDWAYGGAHMPSRALRSGYTARSLL